MDNPNRIDERACSLEIRRLLCEKNEAGVELLGKFCGPNARAFLRSKFRQCLNQIELDAAAFNAALFKAWRYANSIDTNQNLGAWFCRICNNEAIDLCKQMPKLSNYEFSQITIDDNPVEEFGSCEKQDLLIRSLNTAIENLPNLPKRIVLADLRVGGEENAVTLAARFDTTANSIRVSKSKARGKLRRRLNVDHGSDQSLAT